MKNEGLKSFGFGRLLIAVLAMAVASFPLTAQTLPEPGLGFTKEGVEECQPAPTLDPAALAQQREFWQEAWGREPAPDGESMVLQESSSPGVWNVLLGNKTAGRYSARGAFLEESRHPVDLGSADLDQVYATAAKATSVERYVVAGTMIGATGTSIPVAAVLTELGTEKGNVARLFSVLDMAADSGDARAAAEIFVRRSENKRPYDLGSGEDNGFEKSGALACRNNCFGRHNQDLNTCDFWFFGCQTGVFALAASCIATCAPSGPAAALCLAGCDSLLIAGSAVCVTNRANCQAEAFEDLGLCLEGCGCGNSFICAGNGADER